jgi:hypothetical protein
MSCDCSSGANAALELRFENFHITDRVRSRREHRDNMDSPNADPPESAWAELLEGSQMGCYLAKLLGAAINTPEVLTAMTHGDAMDILKEVGVLPGHRHLLMLACAKATDSGEHTVSWITPKVDAFELGDTAKSTSAKDPTGTRVVMYESNHVLSRWWMRRTWTHSQQGRQPGNAFRWVETH